MMVVRGILFRGVRHLTPVDLAQDQQKAHHAWVDEEEVGRSNRDLDRPKAFGRWDCVHCWFFFLGLVSSSDCAYTRSLLHHLRILVPKPI